MPLRAFRNTLDTLPAQSVTHTRAFLRDALSVHPPERKQEALRLAAEGVNDCEISRRMGIPRATIRDWRRPTYEPKITVATCPRCGEGMKPIHFSVDDYSELFAMYLGDGCISQHAGTTRMRISLDKKYPGIIEDGRALLRRTFPSNEIDAQDMETWVNLSVYNQHLPCLFPQHGAGKKHLRPITPELWQWALIMAAPWPFLRGAIRTDGCVFINRTGPYEYLSYNFSNKSTDIARIVSVVLEHVGIRHRMTDGGKRNLWQIRINGREDVARMLEHVGVKE